MGEPERRPTSSRRHGAAGLACLALLASACEPRAAQGASCTRSSECSAPLACALGRCRSECASARDCPLGAICIRAGRTTGVCQLPLGADDECATSACADGLVCAEGRCTDACTVDAECALGARCGPSDACVECVLDADCPRGLRCHAAHRCVIGIGDGGAGDGGAPDAASGVLQNDRCATPAVVDLPTAPFILTYRAHADGWSDDLPSCSAMPDGYFRFRVPSRTLVHFGCGGGPPNGLAPITDCGATTADCSLAGFHNAHFVMPDATLFAMDRDLASPDLELCMEGYPMGPDTQRVWTDGGVVDQTVVLDGVGLGVCGGGADAILIVEGSAGATATLTAQAPGVTLAWQDADFHVCDPSAVGSVRHDITFVTAFAILRLVTVGASGPVTVHLTGTTPI